jgi:hypothetical protein
MADAGPWTEPGYEQCWPIGGVVSGTVTWSAPQPLKMRLVEVELRWRTEGRGDEDKQSPARQELAKYELPAGESSWRFELQIPADGPITYEGHLLRILWETRAHIDIAWTRDQQSTAALTVLPDYDAKPFP